MKVISSVRTALVHHWMVRERGSESVFAALMELFPHANLFTLVCHRSSMQPLLGGRSTHTSFLQYLPRAATWYPYYLLFPIATDRLNLSGYPLIITSDAATLKGVRADPAHSMSAHAVALQGLCPHRRGSLAPTIAKHLQ